MFASRRLELIVSLLVVILDQITKALVRPALALHESREVIPGFLDLTRVHNTGAAFGMLNAAEFPMKPLVLSLVATIALGGVAWYVFGSEDEVVPVPAGGEDDDPFGDVPSEDELADELTDEALGASRNDD